MSNVDRAKQFLPFDALKGLREELEAREEKMSRVPKHSHSEEQMEEISYTIARLNRGSQVIMTFYRSGHYYELKGAVMDVNVIYHYLIIGEEKIFFDDIYSISLADG